MNENTIRRATALATSAVLLASMTVVVAPATAQSLPACTYDMAAQLGYDPTGATVNAFTGSVPSSMVLCGGDGDDQVTGLHVDGTFIGGEGHDHVNYVRGTFIGGEGHDEVHYSVKHGGTFDGGGGNDWVHSDLLGTFTGAGGNDHVQIVDGGTFIGGNGDDVAHRLFSGTFDGGPDQDSIYVHRGGTCVNVESGCRQAQTITFDWHPVKTYGQGPIDLSTKASVTSGLPVEFKKDAGACSVSGVMLTLTGAGNCTVTASQSGDDGWFPATPVSVTLTIKKAPLTITADDQARINLMPNPELTVSYDGFVNGEDKSVLNGTPQCSTTAVKTSPGGTYPITCSGLWSSDYRITWVAGTLTVTYVAPISYDGNQVFVGDTTIRIGDEVKGNVVASDGILKVEGSVKGNIVQTDGGGVIVNGGEVKGNVTESGDGDVVLNNEGTVKGLLKESGRGDVLINAGHVKGNIFEKWDGRVLVKNEGTLVEGNLFEEGGGDVDVKSGAVITGNVQEQGPGSVDVDAASEVEGKVKSRQ